MTAAIHSTIGDVKTQLVSLLVPLLPNAQVWRSWPGDTTERAAVWLGETRLTETIPVMRGAGNRIARQEAYEVDVWISARGVGPDDADAEATALGMFAAVEDALAGNPTLGITGVIAATIKAGTLRTGIDDAQTGGWSAQILAQVEVTARLN